MALLGRATMVAIYDLEAGWESRHDAWHSHEHMPERVGIPGFRRGRRYLADGGGARCFVLYEADSLDVLTSDAYLERLNHPTPWSSEIMPHFRNMVRTLCRVTVSRGRGVGGRMAVVPLSPEPARAEELRGRIAGDLATLVGQPGVLAAHVLEADGAASRIETREKELRGRSDSVADWLLVVEGYEPPGPVLAEGPLGRDALLDDGAASVGEVASYSLAVLLDESRTDRPGASRSR